MPSLHVAHRVSTRDLLGIFGTRPARIGLIAMTLALCGQFATYTYITPFLATVSGFGGKVISLLLLDYTFIGLLGNFIGSSSAQRNVRTTLIASILFIAVPLAMLPVLGTNRSWVLVALAAWGTAYGALPVALQMSMGQATCEVREGGMALFVALTLREARYPAVIYVPRKDVDMTLLERTDHATWCPYKGDCAYFSFPSAGERGINAVRTYEQPYAAVAPIREHLAFYPDRVDAIEVLPADAICG